MPETQNNCFDTEGTLNFCAPEEIFGVSDGFDVFKADLWGLGCLLYDLLFDKLAFDIPGQERFNTEMELNMKI
jgi:serine/threonine protein kinase